MQSKLLNRDSPRIFAVVFETGEEVSKGLVEFARQQAITGASFTAIGAFQKVTLAFFDLVKKEYEPIPIDEQVEVLTLAGNLGTHEGEPKLHAHVVVGLRDGATRGGHLLEAIVRPTLELIVTETPEHLRRTMDEATGLPLIDLES